MIIFVAAIIGLVLGYTSHIKAKRPNKAMGMIEGFTVVTASFWIFYNLNLWWWLGILLSIIAYALYLMILQALTRRSISVVMGAEKNLPI